MQQWLLLVFDSVRPHSTVVRCHCAHAGNCRARQPCVASFRGEPSTAMAACTTPSGTACTHHSAAGYELACSPGSTPNAVRRPLCIMPVPDRACLLALLCAALQTPGLYTRMSDSFGYLTTKGYCSKGRCLKWPVLMGEFSAPHAGGASLLLGSILSTVGCV